MSSRTELQCPPEQSPTLKGPTGWIESYNVKRPQGIHSYFRYCWQEGRAKIHHRHIPGGNTSSGVAQARAAAIKLAIACGDSASAIALRIKGWKKGVSR